MDWHARITVTLHQLKSTASHHRLHKVLVHRGLLLLLKAAGLFPKLLLLFREAGASEGPSSKPASSRRRLSPVTGSTGVINDRTCSLVVV